MTGMISEKVRWANAAGRKLRIAGAGTWLQAGRPVASDETLSLAEQRGIVEYVAGDLTLTARAGTPLTDIASATGAEGQWLPLDPWGGDSGTIGATIASATAGPWAHALGSPRDVVIGVEFVTGTGDTVRAGGRVVKNVAGFDLTRLVTGAWGSLGVITEVTVRLRGKPDVNRTLAILMPPTRTGLNELAVRLKALPFVPLGSEMLNDQFAAHLKLGSQPVLLVRLAGNEKSVAAQMDTMRSLGDYAEVSNEVWDGLRKTENGSTASWRWSQLPTQFGDTWTQADTAARALESFHMHGNPARGVVRVVASAPEANASQVVRSATAFKGTVAVEKLPVVVWPLVSPSAPDALSRAIRDKFDPSRILNRGIMGAD
jgi:glycolate oxidase FAD binding subunit